MTGRRSHGRLSALNGVVHQGIGTGLRGQEHHLRYLLSCDVDLSLHLNFFEATETLFRWSAIGLMINARDIF